MAAENNGGVIAAICFRKKRKMKARLAEKKSLGGVIERILTRMRHAPLRASLWRTVWRAQHIALAPRVSLCAARRAYRLGSVF
jgi:hypothetical protein